MIEKIILEHLKSNIDVPIYLEEPKNKPTEYVLIRMIDSTRTNHIDACTFYVESKSTTLYKASSLNEKVKESMLNDLLAVDSISSCKLGGGGQNIDTQTKTYRYETIFNIVYAE